MRWQLMPLTPVRSPKTSDVVSQEIEAMPLPAMVSGGKNPATDCRSRCKPSSLLPLMVTFEMEVPLFGRREFRGQRYC